MGYWVNGYQWHGTDRVSRYETNRELAEVRAEKLENMGYDVTIKQGPPPKGKTRNRSRY